MPFIQLGLQKHFPIKRHFSLKGNFDARCGKKKKKKAACSG
jgi:hypothetical protein